MLYPINIKIEEKRKRKILKENLENLKNKTVEYSTTSPRAYNKSATFTDAQLASMD